MRTRSDDAASGSAQEADGHPDKDLLATLTRALTFWADTPPTGPTSSVLGGGAIRAAEDVFSELHGGRRCLLVPSATYGLRVALQVLGVRAGDEVLCAAVDWLAGYAAILSLGATARPVAMDPDTLTLDPSAVARARTARTRAVIACHLNGVCADVPNVRAALPGIPVIEDAAQAFGSRLDGHTAGTMGDVAVLSLGPGKQIDAGEGGVLLFDTATDFKRAVRLAAHPARQLLAGIGNPDVAGFSIRPHPMTAILAVEALARRSPDKAQVSAERVLKRLGGAPDLRVLGGDPRRVNALPLVPVLLGHDDERAAPTGLRWTRPGAQVTPGLTRPVAAAARRLLARVRLAACAADRPKEGPSRANRAARYDAPT